MRSEVRLFPDPPVSRRELCLSASALIGVIRRFIGAAVHGAVAQLGEHLLCKQGVTGSIPVSSTIPTAQRKRQVSLKKQTETDLRSNERRLESRSVCFFVL